MGGKRKRGKTRFTPKKKLRLKSPKNYRKRLYGRWEIKKNEKNINDSGQINPKVTEAEIEEFTDCDFEEFKKKTFGRWNRR